jgi:hypothetical protein
MNTWLDAAVVQCPKCGNFHVDASWYLVELASDITCGKCRTEFNGKQSVTDRVILEFAVNDQGKMQNVVVLKHLPVEAP